MSVAAMAVAANLSDAVKIDDLYINFVVGAVIPLLVGLVTKLQASSGLKSVINFGFSAVAGALTTLLGGGSFTVKELVTKVAMTWIASVVAYVGLQKPTGLAGTVAKLAPEVGIGKPVLETADKGLEDFGDGETVSLDAMLKQVTLDELLDQARVLRIKGRTTMGKRELFNAIQEAKAK